jgi:hypothetical protein
MPQPVKPSLTSTPLWPHQKSAVELVRRYLTAAEKDETDGASLVHMPTGTGRSGVIACVSHLLRGTDCVLLLCPRIALREQLGREVGGRFFTKLGLSDELPKNVHEVKNGFPPIADAEYSRAVVSMTIQMLNSLRNRGHDAYAKLREEIGLIIVDEGHYEPALQWRDAIRGLDAPTVIFTANPFRNDSKLFNVDFDFVYSYTLNQAVSDNTIRDVRFHSRPAKATRSPMAFVRDVVEFYDQTFGHVANAPPPRVIIRCESASTIRGIGTQLRALGRSYVLIHENFSDSDDASSREKRAVPDPDHEDAVFWVHQFKLLEGVDDPRFQMLALYEPLKNTRSVVQQVGRILRNPSRQPGSIAHVLDHSGGRQTELWNDFIAFDKQIQEKGVSVADVGSGLLAEIARSQPDVVYIDGRFRTRLTLADIDPKDELLLPASVNVYRKPDNLDLDGLCESIRSEFEEQDRDVRLVQLSADLRVLLTIGFRNSPLLRTKSFIENRFGATIVRASGSYLFFFDSSGLTLPALTDNALVPATGKELRGLFNGSGRTYLTAVGLQNANLGPRAIRSRAVSASRLDHTVPMFDDHSFVCRTAQGYSENDSSLIRRYIGFKNGKISDASLGRLEFEDYVRWLDTLSLALASPSKPNASFARFASHADAPDDPDAVNILLDLDEIRDHLRTNDVDGVPAEEPLTIEDSCFDVNSGAFTILANGKLCSATVSFNPKTKRYVIDSSDLDSLYYSEGEDYRRGLVRYLNTEQSFRLIPGSEGCFYTLGEFYSPILTFGPRYDDDQTGLLKVLFDAHSLAAIGSEKGTQCFAQDAGWDATSLFGIIDGLGVGYGLEAQFGSPDIVVCDDMGTEAADFILAYKSVKRVVFIHAKGNQAAQPSLYAASPLHEVSGQATKNLKYFSRFGSEVPTKARNWHTAHWTAPDIQGRVSRRVRKAPNGLTTGLQIWKEVRKLIRDPYADLEVWLFLGRMFSKTEFANQLRRKKPAPQAKQAAYLLFSTMNDVAAVGGRLKVFCSP